MDKNYIRNCPLAAPGLAIHGASSAVPKVSNTVATKIDGAIYAGVTAADLPALTGINLLIDQQVVLTVQLSAAGVYTYVASAIQTNLAEALEDVNDNTFLFPATGLFAEAADGQATIGWIIIAADHTHPFTGGTTNLDATGITATYIDNFGFVGK